MSGGGGEKRYVCTMLRLNEKMEWMEMMTESFVHLSSGLISLRDISTYALQADLPLNTIEKVETITHANLVRIQTKNHNHLALKFKDTINLNEFENGMKEAHIDFSEVIRDNSTELPDLLQPVVQEYVLRLLFSDTFSEFVDDLEKLINSFERRVATSTTATATSTSTSTSTSTTAIAFFEDEKMSMSYDSKYNAQKG